MISKPQILISILWLFISCIVLEGAQPKPNVLFIMSDDLNTALSGLGHPECKTPHLDAFAKTGVMFTKAFCQYPICGPSRASIMTGQYPLKNGVTGNGGKVKPERMTLPRYFGKHGYWNARVSKIYHMGIPVDIVQGTSGRDHEASWKEAYNMRAMETLTPSKIENFTDPESVAHYPAERAKWIEAKEKGEPYKFQRILRGDYAVLEVTDKDEHLLPDKMATDKAIELLGKRAEDKKPFFLAVGLVRPHFPFVATDSSIRHYDPERTALPYNPENDHDDMAPQAIGKDINVGDAAVRKIRRGYYGAVTYMDQQVGRLVEALDSLKLRENTIVVFVSDHGFLLGEHRMWKKSRLWEEAIRTPLIISAPGMKQGEECDQVVELVDLYPTLTDLAGLKPEKGAQGQSLVPLLKDPTATRSKQDAWIYVSQGHGLRTKKWAYMWYPKKKGKKEASMLYDMEKDPGQFSNVVNDPMLAKIRIELHDRLMERIKTGS